MNIEDLFHILEQHERVHPYERTCVHDPTDRDYNISRKPALDEDQVGFISFIDE